jgi:hypothetical protein
VLPSMSVAVPDGYGDSDTGNNYVEYAVKF